MWCLLWAISFGRATVHSDSEEDQWRNEPPIARWSKRVTRMTYPPIPPLCPFQFVRSARRNVLLSTVGHATRLAGELHRPLAWRMTPSLTHDVTTTIDCTQEWLTSLFTPILLPASGVVDVVLLGLMLCGLQPWRYRLTMFLRIVRVCLNAHTTSQSRTARESQNSQNIYSLPDLINYYLLCVLNKNWVHTFKRRICIEERAWDLYNVHRLLNIVVWMLQKQIWKIRLVRIFFYGGHSDWRFCLHSNKSFHHELNNFCSVKEVLASRRNYSLVYVSEHQQDKISCRITVLIYNPLIQQLVLIIFYN